MNLPDLRVTIRPVTIGISLHCQHYVKLMRGFVCMLRHHQDSTAADFHAFNASAAKAWRFNEISAKRILIHF